MKERLDNIQVLRVISAFGIMMYHSQVFGHYGYFGVEIFNVISGFVMMYASENLEHYNMKKYISKKLIRIIPLYWLWTIFMDLLLILCPWMSATTKHGAIYLIKSLLFIPYTNDVGYKLPIVGVGWTLTYEVAFILISAFAIKCSHKYRGVITSSIIVLLYLINLIWNGIDSNTINDYYSNSVFIEFVYGIIMFYLYKNVKIFKGKNSSIFTIISFLFSVSLYIIIVLISKNGEMGKERGFILGSIVTLFTVCFFIATKDVKMNKTVLWLGNMTYSIYLAEHFTTAVYRVVVNGKSESFKLGTLVLLIIITLLISIVSYYLIEKPMNVLGKRFWGTK